ncbi:MAG: HAD family hydrolase [Candidatus Hodarchaeales archaeon]|jgi:beta-phosphoglucomutase
MKNRDIHGPKKHIVALILDCDGVIVDSEPLSCGAWNIVFDQEYGVDIGTDYEAIMGGTSRASVTHYFNKFNLTGTEEKIEYLINLKDQVYLDIAENKLTKIQGIDSIIDQARNIGWKIGVASSGSYKKIDFNLRQVSLEESFDTISGAKKGLRSKPFPDIFLKAAEQLNIPPIECLVIEDTPAGITAAKQAAMYVVAITTSFRRKFLENADLVIDSYSELELQNFR